MATMKGSSRASLKDKARGFLNAGIYKLTPARQRALEKAQEVSARARSLRAGADGAINRARDYVSSKGGVANAANSIYNKATGSTTSRLRKTQTINAQISRVNNRIQTAASGALSSASDRADQFKGAVSNTAQLVGRMRNNPALLLQRVGLQSTGGKQGPSRRAKVLGSAAKRQSSGPSTRAKLTGAGSAIASLQRKMMRQGSTRSTAYRTASNRYRLSNK